ncbi:MAG TPA: pyridoxamine 5'-phosphate oxidase [Puia sp.]|nr:pyridoxamine 5'-phosphate oxidase [Puia sp.]
MTTLSTLRKEYRLKRLLEADALPDAIDQFDRWWKEATESDIDEPNAMTLATASADGIPSARIVLLKGYSKAGFQFFTNYNSFKGQQLQENPRACLVFLWKELERQIRITGLVEKLGAKESDEYFNSRPLGSRLGALASPQSEVVSDSHWLDERVHELEKQYAGGKVPRPDHWGGYLVKPVTIEFWQGRPNRLHDRLLYSIQDGKWSIERLAP